MGDELHDVKSPRKKSLRLKPLRRCDSPDQRRSNGPPRNSHRASITTRNAKEGRFLAGAEQSCHTCFDRQERGSTLFDRDNRWFINQRQGQTTSFKSTNAVDDQIESIYWNQYKKHSKENPSYFYLIFKNFTSKKHKTPKIKSVVRLIHVN